MDVTLKAVGPDVGAVVARQVRELTAANRKVGNAVRTAGVAAIRKAVPYRSFAGYPLKVKGKIESVGGDHVAVRFYGTPVGFWSMLESGAKPHAIKARRKKALAWGTGDDEAARSVNHPGMAGRRVWTNTEPALRAAVADAVVDTYDTVFS